MRTQIVVAAFGLIAAGGAYALDPGTSATPSNRLLKLPPKLTAPDDVASTQFSWLGVVPDQKITPGAINPCIHAVDICGPGKTTKGRRLTTEKMKVQSTDPYRQYFPNQFDEVTYKKDLNGMKPDEVDSQDRANAKFQNQEKEMLEGQHEIDHLISLEIGGADDVKNLWPEPYQHLVAGAADKDRIEHSSKPELCAILKESGGKVKADTYLALMQRLISRGFTASADGTIVGPKISWYHLFAETVASNLERKDDGGFTFKKGAEISFREYLKAHKQELTNIPADELPVEVPSEKGCTAPKIADL